MTWDLQELFRRHAADITRFLRQRGHDSETAKDITQDTFLRIHNAKKQNNINNIRSYLFRIADNLAKDYFRAAKVQKRYIKPAETFDAIDEVPDPEHIADYRQRLQLLAKAIETLPPRQKEVFLMHKFDGLSHVEIAQKLGITRSAVEKLIIKALAHCRHHLGDLLE
ncbi:RNA polymerase sigma factor [Pseudochrobactrum sp. sp1633]|uniref:RNA polymerase sigma factor n=1 Tax=Pseudochrobactrum sp. sp1633 TaxID=3036706 RepID=UPI0025A5BCB2|nr:RNA polymerase sigma factor [Pseudochrobactrum sp. sp1633]MDM8346581.1 RNA polymerase sigma factor [Pseudochrobactrum sp. sp1633]HWD12645.1 RNA polymerase sigma factor [Pseudochrobactrum sp.]